MSTWQSRLAKMVRFGQYLPEPLAIFRARKPSGRKTWPHGLPCCAALVEFYTLCDGGFFPYYDWLPLRELKKARVTFIKSWARDYADGEVSSIENCLVLAYHDAGDLVWDAGRDLVTSFNSDGCSWEHFGCSLTAFLEDLFTPKPERLEDLDKLWAETLDALEKRSLAKGVPKRSLGTRKTRKTSG